jgi:hypothetical protein
MTRIASPYSLKNSIKTALNHARMENASFGSVADGEIVLRNKDEVDAFIKERTRLWRESWLIPPLERALAKVKK